MARPSPDFQGIKSAAVHVRGQRLLKDHGLEAVALGDLVAKVLATSKVSIDDTHVPVHLSLSAAFIAWPHGPSPTSLRFQLIKATTDATLHINPASEHVQVLRASCTTVIIMYFFFSHGGACIDCLAEDLDASKEDGIRMYHRPRKGPRGVSTEQKLLCHLPNIVHAEVVQVLQLLSEIRRKISDGEYIAARWAIDM
jgi:hypothetical protein